jgi:predicted amidohydrolase
MSPTLNSIFKVGLVQMRSGVDPQANLATALAAIEEAARAGAAYVLTPEMTNIMEIERDRLFATIADEELDPTLAAMREAAPWSRATTRFICSMSIWRTAKVTANRATTALANWPWSPICLGAGSA